VRSSGSEPRNWLSHVHHGLRHSSSRFLMIDWGLGWAQFKRGQDSSGRSTRLRIKREVDKNPRRSRTERKRKPRSVERRRREIMEVEVGREMPESEIAIAKKLDNNDIMKYKMLGREHIGRWAVVNSGYVHLCHTYHEASSLASSLNRSPA